MGARVTVRSISEGAVRSIEEPGVGPALDAGAVMWIDVETDPSGWTDVAGRLESALGLLDHEVDLRSIAAEGMPPKIKVLDDGVVVVRAYAIRAEAERVVDAEIHAVAGDRFLLTVRYAQAPADAPLMAGIEARLTAASRRPEAGGLSLLYVLLDELVDDALEAIEVLDELADALEARVFEPGGADEGQTAARERHRSIQRDILRLKREVGELRRRLLPYGEVRELVQEEARRDPAGRSDFREVAEAVLRVVELADNVRDLLSSAFEAELAQVSNETNDIMKKVTSWAAILLVPTLIAGIYGMNFRHMPELGWGLGYPGALGMMALSAFGLWLVFRRQDWL